MPELDLRGDSESLPEKALSVGVIVLLNLSLVGVMSGLEWSKLSVPEEWKMLLLFCSSTNCASANNSGLPFL